MRLGFAIAAHIDADVLLLDEVFAVGDEQFQRKCFGKIFEFKQRGGTIVFVSHDASAVERLCDRAILLRDGRVEFDGATHDAIVRYRQLLAGDLDPAERGAGLKEWGSGDARIERASSCSGPTGRRARSSSRASRLTLRLQRRRRAAARTAAAVARAARRIRPARRRFGALDGRAGLGPGRRRSSSCASRSTSCRSPTDASTCVWGSPTRPASACTTGSTTRSTFVVYPAGEETRRRAARGPLGRGGNRVRRRKRSRHELAHLSRLAEADGVRAGPAVQALHRRRGEAAGGSAHEHPRRASSSAVAICCDLERHVFYAKHTDPRSGRPSGDALVRAGRVDLERPRQRSAYGS